MGDWRRRARIAGRVAAGAAVAVSALAAAYPVVFRRRCRTWGATAAEVERSLPGDDLLPEPDLVSTRAIGIAAPPEAVWPWLVQMGSGRGGAYTYDWIENLLGLRMRSVDEILPRFQGLRVGDVLPLGAAGRGMIVEVLRRERVLAYRSTDHPWVWIFELSADDQGVTRLISRNRIRTPSGLARAAYTLLMEPGSLVMERKMLLGIKARAERSVAPGGRSGRSAGVAGDSVPDSVMPHSVVADGPETPSAARVAGPAGAAGCRSGEPSGILRHGWRGAAGRW